MLFVAGAAVWLAFSWGDPEVGYFRNSAKAVGEAAFRERALRSELRSFAISRYRPARAKAVADLFQVEQLGALLEFAALLAPRLSSQNR